MGFSGASRTFITMHTQILLRSRSTSCMLAGVLLVGVVAGCGNKTKVVSSTNANGQVTTQTVPDVHFAKTKFLLHSGLAIGAFHRYIYKPYQQGQFKKGAPHRTKALVKAGAAGLFAVHELKVARKDALSDDHLRPLVNKLDGLTGKLGSLAAALKAGSFNPTDLVGAATAVTGFGKDSSSAGATIKEHVPPSIGG